MGDRVVIEVRQDQEWIEGYVSVKAGNDPALLLIEMLHDHIVSLDTAARRVGPAGAAETSEVRWILHFLRPCVTVFQEFP